MTAVTAVDLSMEQTREQLLIITIDEAIAVVSGRSLVPTSEVIDLFLDLRQMVVPEVLVDASG
jgi:hypothetical protein